MIRTGKKFSRPEMSRVINGDTVLPEAEAAKDWSRGGGLHVRCLMR